MDWIAVAILFVARFLDSLGWRNLLLFVVIALAAGSITRAIRGSAAMILEETLLSLDGEYSMCYIVLST